MINTTTTIANNTFRLTPQDIAIRKHIEGFVLEYMLSGKVRGIEAIREEVRRAEIEFDLGIEITDDLIVSAVEQLESDGLLRPAGSGFQLAE